jgi:transposase-like protein
MPLALFDYRRDIYQACDELAKVGPALGDAIERFRKGIVKEARRRAPHRATRPPTRPPATHAHRPIRHRIVRVARLPGRIAPTILRRRRAADQSRGGARTDTATTAEGAVARAVEAARRRIRAVREALLGLQRRLAGLRR